MERICKFYKTEESKWFIDLPEWEGDKAALQMVLGADDLLNQLSKDQKIILVRFSDEGFPGANVMSWYTNGIPGDEEMGGACYEVYKNNLSVWLCDVTLFVFGGNFPKHIYFSRIHNEFVFC